MFEHLHEACSNTHLNTVQNTFHLNKRGVQSMIERTQLLIYYHYLITLSHI
jgi:hypothetical protein